MSSNTSGSLGPQEPPPPPRQSLKREPQERFPHGPRHLDAGDADVPVSREARQAEPEADPEAVPEAVPRPPQRRRRRSVAVSDRHTRSADVGVSGLYEVISEADLAFTPDSKAESVIVFQGRIREEVCTEKAQLPAENQGKTGRSTSSAAVAAVRRPVSDALPNRFPAGISLPLDTADGDGLITDAFERGGGRGTLPVRPNLT